MTVTGFSLCTHRIDASSLASLKNTAFFAGSLGERKKRHWYLMLGFKEKHLKSHFFGRCVFMNRAIFPLKIVGDFIVTASCFTVQGTLQRSGTISEILPSGNSTTIIHSQITHFQQNNYLYMFMLDLPVPC